MVVQLVRGTKTESQSLCLRSCTHHWTTLPPTPLARQPRESGSLCSLAWVQDSGDIGNGEGDQF